MLSNDLQDRKDTIQKLLEEKREMAEEDMRNQEQMEA